VQELSYGRRRTIERSCSNLPSLVLSELWELATKRLDNKLRLRSCGALSPSLLIFSTTIAIMTRVHAKPLRLGMLRILKKIVASKNKTPPKMLLSAIALSVLLTVAAQDLLAWLIVERVP